MLLPFNLIVMIENNQPPAFVFGKHYMHYSFNTLCIWVIQWVSYMLIIRGHCSLQSPP